METQNITLALPKSILKQVKLLAAQRQTSVSSLLTGVLERLVQEEEQYARSQRRHLRRLDRAFDLGTRGSIKTKREELHERR